MTPLKKRSKRAASKAVLPVIFLAVILIFAASAYTGQVNAYFGNSPGNLSGSVIMSIGGAFLLALAAIYLGHEKIKVAPKGA